MPRRVTEITKDLVLGKKIRAAKKRVEKGGKVMIPVGDRLTLQVAGETALSWIFRYLRPNGTRAVMGLGAYPAVTLEMARKAAQVQRELLAQRIDPIEHREALKALAREKKADRTFKAIAEAYIASHRAGWRSAVHAAQWESTLDKYVYPVIGDMDVADIKTEDVLRVLSPIWATKLETAVRVRSRIELVLAASKSLSYREGPNPARWRENLDTLLAKPSKLKKNAGGVKNFAAMPYKDLPAFWATMADSKGTGAEALKFLILTAARSAEVTGAQWDEFNLDAGLWTIPGSRMKAGEEHTVPLSGAALDILRHQLKSRKPGVLAKWVFPGRAGRISRGTMSAAMNAPGVTVHGFRASFRTWAAEQTHYSREVCEMALAHKTKTDTEERYHRSDLLEKRKALMKDWAAYVTTKKADNVIEMKPKASEA